MSSYFSLSFIFGFLIAVIVVYAVAPRRARWVVLLIASYAFFWALSSSLIAFLLISTASVYGCGLGLRALLEKRDGQLAQAKSGKRQIRADCKRRMRFVLVAGILVNLLILIVLKYLGWPMLSLCL